MIDQSDPADTQFDASEAACALVLRALHEPIDGVGGLGDLVPVVASLTEDASPVLLDGLVRLASKDTTRQPALQALLLCAARSSAAWNLIVVKKRDVLTRKKIMYPHFAALVTQAYIATGAGEDEAGLQLRRNLDTFKGAVDLALRGALVHSDYNGNGNGNGNRAYELLRVLLLLDTSAHDNYNDNVFRHVKSSTLIDTLDVLAECGMLQAEHMERFISIITRRLKRRIPSLISARVYATLKAADPHLVADWNVSMGGDILFSRMLKAQGIFSTCDDRSISISINSTEEAYSFAQSERTSRNAERVRKNVPREFIGGAYIAYPEAFEEDGNICAKKIRLDDTTSWLRSTIDDDLDAYLANLLGGVPSLSTIYTSGTAMDNESTAANGFDAQHIADRHPELVRRRAQDLSACLYTIIDGLDDAEERYEPGAMAAILSLVKLMRVTYIDIDMNIDMNIGRSAKYDDAYCGLWSNFLLAEGRAKNGIPHMFADITTAFLAALGRDTLAGKDAPSIRLRKELVVVEQARGTDGRIREAIRALLRSSP